ncbi:MAG: AAA family ATPase [Wenzhouxiangellaceae bacterium]|nr:AAA family ATPase [Wenzhouxiangellaceae bacterium]
MISFGAFELDLAAAELRRRGARVHLQFVPFKVLEMLVSRPGELVRREEFFDRLWPGDETGILDDNLNAAVRKLRTTLRDDARNPRFIETVPRRGYRFIAPVTGAPKESSSANGAVQTAEEGRVERPATRRLSQVFVGRARELADIAAMIDETLAERRGWLVAISGEAGIGKTRMAERLAGRAQEAGFAVLWGRSLEERGGVPYWPWVQVLRGLIRASEDDVLRQEAGPGAADIATIVPELGQRLGVAPTEPLATGDQGRYRLFDSIAGYLQRASERIPLLLVLDNLHWAGQPSLLLLEFLATALTDSPVIILGTYRGSEVSRHHPLFGTLGALNRDTRFVRHQLKGLNVEEVQQFLDATVDRDLPPGLAVAIHRETEGNPFFVTEVVRLLQVEGILDSRSDGSAQSVEQSLVIDIPEGVREVIGKRLNHLTESCNRALSRAAVIGREFDFELLRLLMEDSGEDTLLEAMEEAADAGVVVEDEQHRDCYRFSHTLIRETLYDEISAARRVRWHARVGRALERLHGDAPGAWLPQLAYHFAEAARSGDSARAVDYNRRAGEQAESQLAYEEAAAFYRNALDILELDNDAADEAKCALLLATARSVSKAGAVSETMDLAEQGARIARRLGDSRRLAEICLTLDYVVANMGVGAGRALPLMESALDLLEPGDSALRAELLGALSRACYASGQHERGAALTRKCLDMARRIGDAKALFSGYRATIYYRYPPEDFPTRMSVAREMLDLARELNDLELQCDAHGRYFYDLLEAGELETADWHLHQVEELARTIRQPFYLHNNRVYRAMRAVMEGRYGAAEELAVEAFKAGRRVGRGDSAEGIFGMQMFAIRRDQGRLNELAPVLDNFVRERPADAAWRPGLALMYCKLDRRESAAAEFERLVRNDFDTVPRDALWPTCLAYLAELAAYLGDLDRARALHDFLRPYDGRNLVVGASVAYLGAAAHYLGMLEATLGRPDEAREHYRKAIEMNRRMGARPWIARSQEALAAVMLDDGGDAAEAGKLLDSARLTAREIGMGALAARTTAALERVRERTG